MTIQSKELKWHWMTSRLRDYVTVLQPKTQWSNGMSWTVEEGDEHCRMKAAAGPRTNSNISKWVWKKKNNNPPKKPPHNDLRKKTAEKLTFDSLATVELDLPLPLWRVGLHHDEGASWDSTVKFALGPAGACQRLRGVMGGAWVSLHWTRAVNKHIGYRGDPGELKTGARGHRHGCQWTDNLVTPPACYGGHEQILLPCTSRTPSVFLGRVMGECTPHQPLSFFPLSFLHKRLLSSFYPPLLLLTSSRHPKEVQAGMFYAEGLHSFLLCVALSGSPPFCQAHPESGLKQKPSSRTEQRPPPCIHGSNRSRL